MTIPARFAAFRSIATLGLGRCATISRRGCRTAQVNVTHHPANAGAAGVAGNVLVEGVIGLAVDATTGASQVLVPNPVVVDLDR